MTDQSNLSLTPLYGALIFDVETTGLPTYELAADHPSQPRIIQIAAVYLDDRPTRIMSRLIKPDGWVIDETSKAFEANHITQAMCEEKGVPIAAALDELMEMWSACAVLSSYGMRFDSKLLRGELRRAGRPDCFGLRPEVDLIVVAAAAMKARGLGNGRWVKLSEAVEKLLQRSQTTAHEAQSDAYDAARLYYHFAKNGLLQPKVREGKKDG